jgi:hypothetical protein
MKIKEIINESSTDLVARFWKEGDLSIDEMLNTEANEIINKNKSYYQKYFKKCLEHGVTPVFTDVDNNPTKSNEKWNTYPSPDVRQTAGYRGKQHALARAGIPHQTPQKYDPTYVSNQVKLDNI